MSAAAVLSGGLGVDRIYFDDHLSTRSATFDCSPNQVIINGALTSTDSFESVGILAGNGADTIEFSGGFTQSFNVDAGGTKAFTASGAADSCPHAGKTRTSRCSWRPWPVSVVRYPRPDLADQPVFNLPLGAVLIIGK